MKTIGLVYRLSNCNHFPDGELVEIDLVVSGMIESIFVDGRDMTDCSARELMRALISQRNIRKMIEAETEHKPDDLAIAKKASEYDLCKIG